MWNRLLAVAVVSTAAIFAGCGGGTDKPVAKADAKPVLSDADKALVDKQKLCLVTREPLGSMGSPIKVTVKGRDVFLCCEGCRDAVMKDPDKYLARIDADGAVAPEAPASKETPAPASAPAPSDAPTTPK